MSRGLCALREPPRIVLYGVGRYGQEFARLAHAKGWPVVAAVNRAGEKVGQDLGQLAGYAQDTGVRVQDCDTVELSGLDADVGIVFTTDSLQENWPAYERLLSANLDVICHGVRAYDPWRYDPQTAERIDALARAKGRTFFGTGIWDMTRIWSGILLAGPSVSIDTIRHTTVTQINYPNPAVIERGGLDLTPQDYREKYTRTPGSVEEYGVTGKYQVILEQVLTALGLNVTCGEEVLEPITLNEPVYCKALQRDIQPGRVAGWCFRSTVETEEGVRAEGRMEMRLLPDNEPETMTWEIDGTPRSRLVVERRDFMTAHVASVLNRIPDVIAAPAGIKLLFELGLMRPHHPLHLVD